MDNLAVKLPASRRSPLSQHPGGPICRPIAGGARFSLRLPPASLPSAAQALGLDLASGINRAAVSGARTALRLGPDEWLLLLPEADVPAVAEALAAHLPSGLYALTDISHRQTAIALDGAGASDILNGGCPLDFDLQAFPVGMVTRTLFLKAEIVLWRQSETRFHLEVWRSFAPYVWELLGIIGREYAS
ncbi:sarcosine oxidase subunit gamma [Acidocella sp.]|uniref:sarcosine oxidase subunit gamma n=1 Tax=Acidocella sp. TaxID=50710 RepID=UPI002635328E|nr:sarcosine oxidase subunit gamma family protein [Acidocella sp.]